MGNKENLIANIKQASPKKVKTHLIKLIEMLEESQIIEGHDNGYVDNDNDIPLLDFYIKDYFMFTNFLG